MIAGPDTRGNQDYGPDVAIYDRTPEEQIIERAREAQIVLTNKAPLKAETLNKLPELKMECCFFAAVIMPRRPERRDLRAVWRL